MAKQKQYIDRTALLRQAETLFDGQREVMGVKAEHIYSAPVAEVAEVVHGEWEEIKNAYGQIEGWLCKCGREVKSKENYCPNCGAKMDGGKQE